jgi:hypothetical protein
MMTEGAAQAGPAHAGKTSVSAMFALMVSCRAALAVPDKALPFLQGGLRDNTSITDQLRLPCYSMP